MAQHFASARVTGCDFHDASIAAARKAAASAGVADRVTFEVAAATEAPGPQHDLVVFVDSLHDLGDPVGALARARELLAPGGAVLLVEPRGADRVEENFHPIGRMFYAVSTHVLHTHRRLPGRDGARHARGTARARRDGTCRRLHARSGRCRSRPRFNLVLELRP